MHQRWQLQQAKAKLSEVVERAISDGPQIITRHGKDAVIVVSAEQFGAGKKNRDSLVDFFRKSPLVGLDLDFTRSQGPSRPTPECD
jgi:prevent-host-death family protein